MERLDWSYWGTLVMTFEELKVRIKDNSNVVLRANKSFVKKYYNIRQDLNCDSIILIAELELSGSYHRNHVKIEEEVIAGGCKFLREHNKNMSSDEAILIAHAGGNSDDGRGIAVLFIHNDEDCSGIEVLNVCEYEDCGL